MNSDMLYILEILNNNVSFNGFNKILKSMGIKKQIKLTDKLKNLDLNHFVKELLLADLEIYFRTALPKIIIETEWFVETVEDFCKHICQYIEIERQHVQAYNLRSKINERTK